MSSRGAQRRRDLLFLAGTTNCAILPAFLLAEARYGTLTIKAESMGSETLIEIAKVGGIKIDVH
jgi:hypothetical protein